MQSVGQLFSWRNHTKRLDLWSGTCPDVSPDVAKEYNKAVSVGLSMSSLSSPSYQKANEGVGSEGVIFQPFAASNSYQLFSGDILRYADVLIFVLTPSRAVPLSYAEDTTINGIDVERYVFDPSKQMPSRPLLSCRCLHELV